MVVLPQANTVIFRHMLALAVNHFEAGASLFSFDACGFGSSRTTITSERSGRWSQVSAIVDASRRTVDLSHIERFQAYVVSALEHAKGNDELLGEIDTLLDDEQYWTYRHDAHVQILKLQVGQTTSHEPAREFIEALGAENGKKLKRISTLVHQLHKAHAKFVRWREEQKETVASSRTSPCSQDKLAFLTDHRNPPEVKEALLADLRIEPLSAAINWLAGVSGARQRVRAMLDVLHESVTVALRFWASIPITDVPEDIVPASDRLNVASIVARHEARETHYQRSLATARAQSFAVFPPLEATTDGG